ncbi:schwannomin-interacting protein 1 [Coregonus clupeaformis]|uniref:Schwannomin interacting protein 1 C-terminal domain-containing protein n=1 Tax=Coregonus suidteri TaxID=861788 RepID=A0AAN8QYQ0_9TELE|nr:schwannomin-interacting protein 1 [Coregonus clupeaformis]XP_041750650.2 schwannomin-interacting protein 1 [Coregonus clupeaformis]
MEGDTEKETAEEKESDDTELSGEERAGRLHQNGGSSEDDQDLPIMQWGDLSLRIAELEKQEEERRERLKSTSGSEQGSVSGGWAEKRQDGLRRREEWQEEDYGRCRVTVVSSRFHNHKNLQLCYTNNSESEDGDDEEEGAGKEGSIEAGSRGYHPSGLKLEVRAALSALKNKLLAEQKEKEHLACSSVITKRKHLECCDLQICSIQQLNSIRTSLNYGIHNLSSELVGHLLIRDQLRTKQDAMLLDVQDLT